MAKYKPSKLNIVNHEDYIPKEYFLASNSHVIEINIHRTKGLSEQFVYFNDDIFITKPVENTDLLEGYPNDIAVMDIAF